jgi:hypothetical protein
MKELEFTHVIKKNSPAETPPHLHMATVDIGKGACV